MFEGPFSLHESRTFPLVVRQGIPMSRERKRWRLTISRTYLVGAELRICFGIDPPTSWNPEGKFIGIDKEAQAENKIA